MSGFDNLMLGLSAFAALLFVALLLVQVKRSDRRGGFEPPGPRPAPLPPISPPVSAATPAPAPPPYAAWRLISREIANPGSAGGPLFRLRIAPEGGLPIWQAGAVARIYCGPAQEALDPGGIAAAPAGEYMIGSLPEDGAIDLVIRLRTNAPSDEGQRSHWLCQQLGIGDPVALALCEHRDFAPPRDEVPLILIGNATGLAGLHIHIKTRPPGTRNWLIYGDRNSADDKVFAAEIAEWVSTGHLERCDLVFPGEAQERRRVVDQIEEAREPMLDWVLAGAAIYVCGSTLMGEDVHTSLTRLLGSEVIDAMADEGLYRRALY